MHRVASAHRAALRTIELVLRHRCDLSSTADRETANWQSQLSSLLQELTLCCAKLELCEVTPISVGHLEVADMKKKNRGTVCILDDYDIAHRHNYIVSFRKQPTSVPVSGIPTVYQELRKPTPRS